MFFSQNNLTNQIIQFNIHNASLFLQNNRAGNAGHDTEKN